MKSEDLEVDFEGNDLKRFYIPDEIPVFTRQFGWNTVNPTVYDGAIVQILAYKSDIGITSLNGLSVASQTFATGTTGTDFGISSAGSVHTFNLPDASVTARGLITTGLQSFAGDKTLTGIVTLSNTTVSTNTTTGALVVAGGIGVAGKLNGSTAQFSGSVTANLGGFIYLGGNSSQFLKADGSIDSNTYLTSLSGSWLTSGNAGSSLKLGTIDSNTFDLVSNNLPVIRINGVSSATSFLNITNSITSINVASITFTPSSNATIGNDISFVGLSGVTSRPFLLSDYYLKLTSTTGVSVSVPDWRLIIGNASVNVNGTLAIQGASTIGGSYVTALNIGIGTLTLSSVSNVSTLFSGNAISLRMQGATDSPLGYANDFAVRNAGASTSIASTTGTVIVNKLSGNNTNILITSGSANIQYNVISPSINQSGATGQIDLIRLRPIVTAISGSLNAIYSDITAGSNRFFINHTGTAISVFGGNVQMIDTTAKNSLWVSAANVLNIGSTSFQNVIIEAAAGVTISTLTGVGTRMVVADSTGLLSQQPIPVNDTAFDITWDGVTEVAPSKNSVYDKISADNIQFKFLAKATGTTGLVNRNDTFALIALNDTTLRINAVGAAFFRGAVDLPESAIKSFAQQDYALSLLAIPTNTIALRYIGYDKLGVVQVSSTRFSSENILELGSVTIKDTAGVITFLDGAAGVRNVFSSPDMASNNFAFRTLTGNSSTVTINPNANTTIQSSAGFLLGLAIDWGTSNIDKKAIASQATLSFAPVNPSSALSPTPPAFTTIVSTNQYWNGSTMTNLTGTQATVKRIMMARNGQFYIQEGENVFANLADAKNAITTVLFTDVFPSGTFIDICKFAVERNASNLADDTKAFFLNSSTSSGGGGGAGGGIVVSQAEIDFGITNAFNTSLVISDVLISATSKIILSLSGDDTVNYNVEEILMKDIRVVAGSKVVGVGFTIKAYCPQQTTGKFKVNYTITY